MQLDRMFGGIALQQFYLKMYSFPDIEILKVSLQHATTAILITQKKLFRLPKEGKQLKKS